MAWEEVGDAQRRFRCHHLVDSTRRGFRSSWFVDDDGYRVVFHWHERIFSRWRQEHYFKCTAEEFALDALVEYGAEEVAETADRRNPQGLRLTRRSNRPPDSKLQRTQCA